MIKRISVLLSLVLLNHGFARLGDTQDDAEARYGLPKKSHSSGHELIENARELTFEYEGWKIRCALLKATDGKEYIVREKYSKIWNAQVMKSGGVIRIRDYERNAVLNGEAGSSGWSEKILGEFDRDPSTAIANQLIHLSGINGKVWLRADGAAARVFSDSILMDLPQARQYEAELKIIKDQKARAAVPKF